MSNDVYTHIPVLLNEAIDALQVHPNHTYLDGTFGRGSHSRAILDRLQGTGALIAFDKDKAAFDYAQEHFKDNNFFCVQESFAKMKQCIHNDFSHMTPIRGVLFDLGVSSPQLDDARRGFSFMKDGPLDMRMNHQIAMTASEWLMEADVSDIKYVLKVYGEEKFATRIARAIVEQRKETPITTTLQLAKLIEDAVPVKDKYKHPATRSFQAIRIHINEELSDLETGLQSAYDLLEPGGRLAVISFHSLEDRIVKRYFKKMSRGDEFPADLPITQDLIQPKLKLIGRAKKPTQEEVEKNPRSRSAILRVAEKC